MENDHTPLAIHIYIPTLKTQVARGAVQMTLFLLMRGNSLLLHGGAATGSTKRDVHSKSPVIETEGRLRDHLAGVRSNGLEIHR